MHAYPHPSSLPVCSLWSSPHWLFWMYNRSYLGSGYVVTEPEAQNYFPATAMAALVDKGTAGIGVSFSSSHGVSSLTDGTLKVMLTGVSSTSVAVWTKGAHYLNVYGCINASAFRHIFESSGTDALYGCASMWRLRLRSFWPLITYRQVPNGRSAHHREDSAGAASRRPVATPKPAGGTVERHLAAASYEVFFAPPRRQQNEALLLQ